MNLMMKEIKNLVLDRVNETLNAPLLLSKMKTVSVTYKHIVDTKQKIVV